MEIKVCGMRESENILQLIEEIDPDWMGLIFYSKSPRFVSDESSRELSKLNISKVGVFVNETEAEILRKVALFDLKAVQLHGGELPEFVEQLSKKTNAEIWKVISVNDQIDWGNLKSYLPFVSKFLFDTASPKHGGTGQKFDWTVLETYPFDKGFLLSGGIDEESWEEILTFAAKNPRMQGVDLNSKFEDAPGLKNIEKLKKFIQQLPRN
ncbi:MAG: phosphoribosylanthranilate isomerase [Algoriphagus sp.]|uniref:phosphoribosylanthranilate isomerase n=1 Tax=Algoriphagus sp. TaxID=1872435 RepID=UPI00260DB113|nr:phosphoribosylanthranilate isomerase [Algoriphagus sp.]MDG1278568.1 phosphoribosylanthranilate isomerase [Algoriphagus sp.]